MKTNKVMARCGHIGTQRTEFMEISKTGNLLQADMCGTVALTEELGTCSPIYYDIRQCSDKLTSLAA